MRILADYEMASGQKVNVGKCDVGFSKKTGMATRQSILSRMGIYIQAKVEARVRGWKGKLLSQAGREVMIKSVTSAIPNFIMNCFKLPQGTIDDLNRKMARYFWANGNGEKGIH
ncbi:hypothetical protein LIER_08358 [Lithospermum erythrorhizon]|uniref:Reverse transcriptase n=1 Tax=Lithospermum erythrorhizon TaxID=34254 RepID=A0AAV3PBU9_LITER